MQHMFPVREHIPKTMLVLLHLLLLFGNAEAQPNSIVGTLYSNKYYTSSLYNKGNCGYITCWGTTTQGNPFTRTINPIELRVSTPFFTGNLISGTTIQPSFLQKVTLNYTWEPTSNKWNYTVYINNLTKDLEGDYQCFLGFASPTHTIIRLVEEGDVISLPNLTYSTGYRTVDLKLTGVGQPSVYGLVIRNEDNDVIHESVYSGSHSFSGGGLAPGLYYIDYDLNQGTNIKSKHPCGYVYGKQSFTISETTLDEPPFGMSCNGARLVLKFERTHNVDKMVLRYGGQTNFINLNVTNVFSVEITTRKKIYIDLGHTGNQTYPFGYELSAIILVPYEYKVLVNGLVTLFLSLAIIACCSVFLYKTKDNRGELTTLRIVLAAVVGVAVVCCLFAAIIVPASASSCSFIREDLAAVILSVLCSCCSIGLYIYTVVTVVRARHSSESRVGSSCKEEMEGSISGPLHRNGQLPPLQGINKENKYS